VIVADTSALLALFNDREPDHEAVRRVVESHDDLVVVSPFVIAELDYLVATRHGVDAELAVLAELSGGAYELPSIGTDDLKTAAAVVAKYRDQDIGVADASLVVLAALYRTRMVMTLDRRHFGVLRPLDGGRFRVLPLELPGPESRGRR
jgi:predicted nucleic acid-binding protein